MALKKSLKDRLSNIKQKLDEEVAEPRSMDTPEISEEEQIQIAFRAKFKEKILDFIDEIVPGINEEMKGVYVLKHEHSEQEEAKQKERKNIFCLVTRNLYNVPDEEQINSPFFIFQGYPLDDNVRFYTNKTHEDPEQMEGQFLKLEEIETDFIEHQLVELLDQPS